MLYCSHAAACPSQPVSVTPCSGALNKASFITVSARVQTEDRSHQACHVGVDGAFRKLRTMQLGHVKSCSDRVEFQTNCSWHADGEQTCDGKSHDGCCSGVPEHGIPRGVGLHRCLLPV